ncbi:hypothetical protein [Pseudaminobacter soli (ex Li et al. 2025)]|uniref:Argininosuccinate lyase n=1 Tax=Pseudaminobacter soli (ex Li et al. 2025) TaxID=1295366 RepID=A0A2P7RXI8_9HYPH|nr:hypothetical protein [Mesorhizobium soli]PSJ54940.1 hypothetical protein C7I85_27240 [Mesorhizobium soli]
MTFDVRAIAAGAVAVCLASAVSAKAEDLVFTLTNGTGSVLTEFYTSPTGVDNWEADVLGRDVLNPGESATVTIADGRSVCNYDMRFEFTEDSDLTTTTDTQNLCDLGSYTIHE